MASLTKGRVFALRHFRLCVHPMTPWPSGEQPVSMKGNGGMGYRWAWWSCYDVTRSGKIGWARQGKKSSGVGRVVYMNYEGLGSTCLMTWVGWLLGDGMGGL